MDNEALCRALMAADTEAEVIQLLSQLGYWNDPNLWRYIGDSESNWSTIGNQQSDPIAALAEKFVNSIDARLLNACLEAGIDPKGPDAPTTMREAVARFFEHAPNPTADHVGRVANWTDPEIREQARLLTLAVTGKPNHKPCLNIADVGDGQTPDGVPHSFMSLNKRNKVDIPFVQGKYNMGGTGALCSCGENKIQLLVTRRNPALLSNANGRGDEWGFTITRWESIGGRNPVFSYLAPVGVKKGRDGGILSFRRDTMPILPEASKEHRNAYHREVTFGSLLKLFEYDFPRTSDIIRTRGGLRQRIETQLPELALPIGVFECRPDKKGTEGGSFFTPARGTATRLEQEKNLDQLEFPPEGGLLNLRGFEIRITAYAFKRVPGQKKRDGFLADYAQGAGVLYTLNGQTHAKAGNEFFTREPVGLGDYLRNDLLVTVDCSGVDEMTHAQLFMTSRDRARLTPLWRDLEKLVERFLKQNDALQELARRRREDAIREKTEDDNALADLLGKVFQASPDLAKLLLGGSRLPSPFAKPGTGRQRKAKDFKGKRFPSFFHFDKLKANEELKRRAEVGRELRISFSTDAENNYFMRPTQPGSMAVTLTRGDETTEVSAAMLTLSSGVAKWSCDLPDDARVGDLLIYDFVVTDSTQPTPFRNRLRIEVVPRSDRGSGSGGQRKKRGNDGDGSAAGDSGLALPQVYPIKHGDQEWDEYDFDEATALYIRRTPGSDNATSYDFFYNADNESLLRAQKEKPQDKDITRERFKCALVMVGLALIQESSQQRKRKPAEADLFELEALVRLTTRAVAPVLLPLVEFVATLSPES